MNASSEQRHAIRIRSRGCRASAAWKSIVLSRGAAWGAALVVAWGGAWGCASDPFDVVTGGTLLNRELGYRIATPGRNGADAAGAEAAGAETVETSALIRWRRISLEGADLAYRAPDRSAISLSSNCRKTRATAEQLSRHLSFGTSRDGVLYRGAIAHAGDPGWVEVLDSHSDAGVLRIKSVTVVSGGCVFDWLLVASGPEAFERALPDFDRWWASFSSRSETVGAAQ